MDETKDTIKPVFRGHPRMGNGLPITYRFEKKNEEL